MFRPLKRRYHGNWKKWRRHSTSCSVPLAALARRSIDSLFVTSTRQKALWMVFFSFWRSLNTLLSLKYAGPFVLTVTGSRSHVACHPAPEDLEKVCDADGSAWLCVVLVVPVLLDWCKGLVTFLPFFQKGFLPEGNNKRPDDSSDEVWWVVVFEICVLFGLAVQCPVCGRQNLELQQKCAIKHFLSFFISAFCCIHCHGKVTALVLQVLVTQASLLYPPVCSSVCTALMRLNKPKQSDCSLCMLQSWSALLGERSITNAKNTPAFFF